ncbi:MAG TPA: adenylate/guanylate cyclase domain-containing protein [Methylomirabilota bacterium]|nr:adenylate/guanylate cyclase domain-containing protein [Methylomirabilota bacterium]
MKALAWWRARRARLLQLWAVGLLSSMLVTALSALGQLESWQVRGLDLLLHLQGQRVPHDVRIVAIDEAAFEGLGRRQPLPRDYLARVIRGLQRSGAAAVGLDITLAAPTHPADDAALSRALLDFAEGGVSRVVVVAPLGPGSGPLGAATLGRAVVVGSSRVPEDDDGLIRRIMPFVPDGEAVAPALPLAVYARFRGVDPATLARRAEEWPINYVGRRGTILTIPSDTIAALADATEEPAADNPLRGRIVMVGGAFEDSRDIYRTPQGRMAGVEIHANVVHMLTSGRLIRPSSWLLGFAIDAAVVLVAGVVLLTMRPLLGTLVCVVGAFVIGVPAASLAFDRGGYWIDFLLPVLATCVMGLGTDYLARRRVRDSFGRYLSRELLTRVLDDAPSLRGERRVVSILFSDLRGYTTLSEGMTPEAIVSHLNEYFHAMTAAIFAHRGLINDFVGDAVMAIFGAPVPDGDHALHAVQAATAMDKALIELNQRWTARGLPLFQMGIGIHTGSVFAGNVGGRDRIKYTVIGDPVNVASRVEGLNKELSTTILITAETLAVVGDRVQVKDRGPMHVKGRVEEVRVYEVLAIEPSGAVAGRGGSR